jgi:hypothetical protein
MVASRVAVDALDEPGDLALVGAALGAGLAPLLEGALEHAGQGVAWAFTGLGGDILQAAAEATRPRSVGVAVQGGERKSLSRMLSTTRARRGQAQHHELHDPVGARKMVTKLKLSG